ncbi:hypothetical protein [Paenibacillus polymyxa]|uniref:hypothetical protein n=1 Tax=Paenibacillus polymyxa TaxID=1406 RepID=UPI0032AFB48F
MTNRLVTNSYKWDVGPGELPMWVADMDFETSPAIVDALQKRLNHRIYGYTSIPDTYYDAVPDRGKRDITIRSKKNGLCFARV